MNKITFPEREKIYTDAADTFGATTQLIVALEELSEAQKEICKALRGECNLYHLAEEVADATIVLEQVRQLFKMNDLVCDIMDTKVLRLRDRIQKAEEDRRQQMARVSEVLQAFSATDKKAVVE